MAWLRNTLRMLIELLRPEKSHGSISRLLSGEITDSGADSIRKSIEAISANTGGVALCLFAVALLCVIVLRIFTNSDLLTIFLLFAILLFYHRLTETRIRLAQESNKAILLRLVESSRRPQLELPLDVPRSTAPRRRRARAAPGERLPGIE